MINLLINTTGQFDGYACFESALKIRIDFSKNGDFIKVLPPLTFHDNGVIESIGISQRSNRIQIIVFDGTVRVRFLTNWKNDYTYKGKKYSAKLGLGSPCWNVWAK